MCKQRKPGRFPKKGFGRPSPGRGLPLSVVLAEADEEVLVRHLTLFDLVVIGVAGTLGTGIFAVVGLIGHDYAGPAGIISWMLAGIGCVFSGLSYAELSSIIPSQGGAYAYAFVALGELPAAITAWCLTLEFGISSASVARMWADKVLEWVMMGSDSGMRRFAVAVLDPFPALGISPVAAGLQALCVFVLLKGVSVGKNITTVLTALKVAVCMFIIVAGLALFEGNNLVPFAPMGVAGIGGGTAVAFYGYIGFDEVCSLAGEAINPRKNVPLSMGYTLAIVGVAYALSALALAGMVASDTPAGASFVLAFSARGWEWASKIVAIGELVSLPVVVIAVFMVQPRLLSALAKDGLLPKSMSAMDEQGVLRTSTLISGAALVLTAGGAPFAILADFISAGVQICFAITNSCAIIVRRSNLDPTRPEPCRPLVLLFNGLCLLAALMAKLSMSVAGAAGGAVAVTMATWASAVAAGLAWLAAGVVMLAVSAWCPEPSRPLGGPQAFRGPFCPWVSAVGVGMNWFLITQFSWGSLLCTFLAVVGVCVWYFVYGCLAWQNSGASLEKKYDAVRNATRQKLDEELAKTKMKQGQDPDDFLYIKETVGDCLLDMGEHMYISKCYGDPLKRFFGENSRKDHNVFNIE
eukprot:jgi/Undpi1/9208/HiC_scaffold_26.g11666.m1